MEKSEKARKPNNLLRRERKKRGLSQSRLAELIGADPSMISRWESGARETEPFYQEKLCEFFGKDAIELGFLDTQKIIPLTTSSANVGVSSDDKVNRPNYNGQSQLIIPISQSLTPEAQSTLNRQDFLRGAVRVASTLLLTSNDLFITELLERCTRALKKPSTIDTSLLVYIERRTAVHWQDRHGALLSSHDLLSYVLEHFQKVVSLLESSLLPTVRDRLCSTVSEVAQLAGHLLFDMGDYIKAREFHTIAITAAQEANDLALQAVAWGRMSLTWTYSGIPQKALECIQEACRLASSVNSTVRAYLAAVEAEIQAILGDRGACLKALDNAENFEEHQYSHAESYWLRFDHSRLAGYKGICFQRLYRLENNRNTSFLTEAQNALTDALEQLSPSRIQRRPVLLADLASVFAKQGVVEAACEYATQAMSITTQARSTTVLKHLLELRQDLIPWEKTSYVKALDERMTPLLMSGR